MTGRLYSYGDIVESLFTLPRVRLAISDTLDINYTYYRAVNMGLVLTALSKINIKGEIKINDNKYLGITKKELQNFIAVFKAIKNIPEAKSLLEDKNTIEEIIAHLEKVDQQLIQSRRKEKRQLLS
jgi:hypothetical protein